MLEWIHNMIAFAGLLTAAVYYPPKDITTATVLLDIDKANNRLWDMLSFGDAVSSTNFTD